jgi:hypothetical protein
MPKGKRLPSKLPKLPSLLPRRKVIDALVRLGYSFHHEGQKHTLYLLTDRPGVVASIPRHTQVTLAVVIREITKAGFEKEDFVRAYSE